MTCYGYRVLTLTAGDAARGRGRARDERVAVESARAAAHGHVVAHVALGVDAARRRARADAAEVVAHFVGRALVVLCWGRQSIWHLAFSIEIGFVVYRY